MRYALLSATLLLGSLSGHAQAVSDLNVNYWYDPLAEVIFQWKPLHHGDSMAVFFRTRSNNAAATRYLIKWEKRESFSQRQGSALQPTDTITLSKDWQGGRLMFANPTKPWLLVVRLINIATGKSWLFYKQLEGHHPVNGYVLEGGVLQWDAYLISDHTYALGGSGHGKTVFVSYYKDNFPTPSPPFVSKEVKMDRFLFPDSVFQVAPGGSIGPFTKDGLYLAQEDTTSALGYSFLVKRPPYPKYNRLADLKGPLLFVTTREENDALGRAGEDKALFDKVILDITKDTERARTFMRNYFRRIEMANYLFTSFKEGWKTDRGMIFTIFGLPDEVHHDGGFEDWSYKNPRQAFRFARAGSVYHPDHSVLVRDKDYTEYWYQTIDLWRKSRF